MSTPLQEQTNTKQNIKTQRGQRQAVFSWNSFFNRPIFIYMSVYFKHLIGHSRIGEHFGVKIVGN